MSDVIKSNLYPCAHCGETGTCKNGKDDASCASCIKKNELKKKEYTGLLCGSCGGIGKAEPLTERMDKRTKPMLALGTVIAMFGLIIYSLLSNNPHFTTVLAFAGTLIGTITGYYFSSNKTN